MGFFSKSAADARYSWNPRRHFHRYVLFEIISYLNFRNSSTSFWVNYLKWHSDNKGDWHNWIYTCCLPTLHSQGLKGAAKKYCEHRLAHTNTISLPCMNVLSYLFLNQATLFASISISKVASTYFLVENISGGCFLRKDCLISASWLCAGHNLLMQDKKQLIFPVPIWHIKHKIQITDGGRSLRVWGALCGPDHSSCAHF